MRPIGNSHATTPVNNSPEKKKGPALRIKLTKKQGNPGQQAPIENQNGERAAFPNEAISTRNQKILDKCATINFKNNKIRDRIAGTIQHQINNHHANASHETHNIKSKTKLQHYRNVSSPLSPIHIGYEEIDGEDINTVEVKQNNDNNIGFSNQI